MDDAVAVHFEELDDHGHSTLVVHGEPEIVSGLLALVVITLGVAAEDVLVADPETGETRELSLPNDPDEEFSSDVADAA
ncbi:MAG: hypothetical protein KGL39_38070 [Patescibacteria group bacterium]|nr:hypothetical protein [Patescibacteria group bacterium]